MVNLTQCAVCGRVIPATLEGCAYCESEREPEVERPYLALSVRLLLLLFAFSLVMTALWSGITLYRLLIDANHSVAAALPTFFRMLLASFALGGLVSSRPWGWYACLAFVVMELAGGILLFFGPMSRDLWSGPGMALIWTVLFLFVLIRGDVHARFDRTVADRLDVLALLDSIKTQNRTR